MVSGLAAAYGSSEDIGRLEAPKAPPRSLMILRCATAALLLGFTLAGGYMSYKLAQRLEMKAFVTRYGDASSQLEKNIKAAVQSRVRAADAMALVFTPPPVASGEPLFFPDFPAYAEPVMESLDATNIAVLNVVQPEEKKAYEEHIAQHWQEGLSEVQDQVMVASIKSRFVAGIRDMLFTVHPNGSYASGHYPPASEEAVADRQRAAAAAAAAAEGCGAADESEDAFPFKQAPFYTADLHVWPMRGYPLLLNSNNDSARSGAFRAAMAARRTTSTGLTLVGSDWIARGITRVATMLVTPLYWDPVKRKGVQVTQQQVEQQPRQQQCQQPPPSASAAAAGGGPPTRSEPILTGFLDINFAWTSILRPASPSFCNLEVVIKSPPPNVNVDFSVVRGQHPDVESSSYTLLLAQGDARDVGWGDVRKITPALRHFERTFNVSIGPATFTLLVSPQESCIADQTTRTPHYTAAGVVLTALVVTAAGAAYDFVSRRHLAALSHESMEHCMARVKAEAAAVEAKHNFVTCISHELRTPLNAITASAALLNDPSTGPLNAAQRDLLQMLDSGASNVVTIVDDILNLHSLTKGSFQIRVEEVDLLRQVVEPAWRMLSMQPALRERLGGLTLTRRLGEDLPATIRTDATRLMQILINVLNNAAKFTERGSIVFEVDRVSEPTDGVRFRITDTGVGIAPEKQQLVFDLFTQADSNSSRVFQGTGIGLSIGRRLASALGGQLELHSEGLGKGCQFTLTLPMEPPTQRGEPPMSAVGPSGELQRVFGGETYLAGSSAQHGGGRGLTVLLPLSPSAGAGPSSSTGSPGSSSGHNLSGDALIPTSLAPRSRSSSAASGSGLSSSSPVARRSPLGIAGAAGAASSSQQPPAPQQGSSSPKPPEDTDESEGSAQEQPQATASSGSSDTAGQAAQPPVPTAPQPPTAEEPPAARKRILVAEDDRLNQILVRKLLEKFQFEVVMTGNGELAVEQFARGGRFDAVLLDINMPVLDGHGAARQINELIRSGERPPTPLVALSASCSEEELKRCAASNMVAHIPKPLKLESLSILESLITAARDHR